MAGERSPRPTHADIRAYKKLEQTRLAVVLGEARVWRNGYAMLASGAGVVIALIGGRLDGLTPCGWRLVLSALLGGGVAFVAWALWLVLTIEGGKRAAHIELREVIREHNSFTMYEVSQASAALRRLHWSKVIAGVGAVLIFLGLMTTLWVPSPPAAAETPVATSLPAVRPSMSSTPTPTQA